MSKGAGWKMSMVSRVSMMSMFSRVSMMSEGCSLAAIVRCVGGGHRARYNGFATGGKVLRNEEPSRRSGSYTRMTTTRRASKVNERYLCRRIAESSRVYRMVDPIFGRLKSCGLGVTRSGIHRAAWGFWLRFT